MQTINSVAGVNSQQSLLDEADCGVTTQLQGSDADGLIRISAGDNGPNIQSRAQKPGQYCSCCGRRPPAIK